MENLFFWDRLCSWMRSLLIGEQYDPQVGSAGLVQYTDWDHTVSSGAGAVYGIYTISPSETRVSERWDPPPAIGIAGSSSFTR